MNLVEHCIKEIHSVTDMTDEFEKHCGYRPEEPFLRIDLTYDCYGTVKRTEESFWKSDFEKVKKKGYYLA